MPRTTSTLNGWELQFERRKYDTTTYTWVEVKVDGKWYSLGDPWPCVTPKESEVKAAIASLLTAIAENPEKYARDEDAERRTRRPANDAKRVAKAMADHGSRPSQFNESEIGGAFDGFTVTSDADPGL